MLNGLATTATAMLTTTTPTNGIDITIVDSILEVTRTILGMFTVFPLNIYLTAGLVTIGVAIFTQLKHS